MKSIGYIIGMLVVIPLIIYMANKFFLKGNGAKEKEVNLYIQNSFIDTIIIPEKHVFDNKNFMPRLRRGGGSTAYYFRFTYFDSSYQKYLALSLFSDFEPNGQGTDRWFIFRPPATVMVYINKTQLHNPAYGTKENPVPVFPIDLIKEQYLTDEREIFHVSDTVNRIFVEQYLNHFMPKEEFKKMFRSNGK